MKLYEAEKIVKQNVPESVYAIAERFIKHNYKIYLVGGVIRDILLRREYNKSEIDLATDARPDDVKRIFGYIIPKSLIKTILNPFLFPTRYDYRTQAL